eukprot:1972657-Rhodomonas_salina.1
MVLAAAMSVSGEVDGHGGAMMVTEMDGGGSCGASCTSTSTSSAWTTARQLFELVHFNLANCHPGPIVIPMGVRAAASLHTPRQHVAHPVSQADAPHRREIRPGA